MTVHVSRQQLSLDRRDSTGCSMLHNVPLCPPTWWMLQLLQLMSSWWSRCAWCCDAAGIGYASRYDTIAE